MRVHVIAAETTGDQVLARLARDLVRPDWTLGTEPDKRADVNYFLPYLLRDRFPDFRLTKTAAWFTHKETTRPGKVRSWERAADSVDLRLTSARLYLSDLERHGPTALVTPAIDHGKFQSATRTAHSKSVVGVSGFVYPGGRKGEDLVARLAKSDLGKRIELRASGQGWPVPIEPHVWGDLEQFYHGLNVYLCTSTIEGIPMPPLEAMACGIPVVIPRGVGLLDELPDIQNLHRYPADDYEAMVAAIETALAEPINLDSLTGATARFTVAAWQSDHEAALAELVAPKPAAVAPVPPARELENLPDWRGRAGVYYVAFGGPARDCALRAINSLHRYLPGVPAALVSDAPLGPEDVFIRHTDEDLGGRSVKTKIYDLAPAEWEYVLYLDADTEIVADCSFLFDALRDGWELVCCTNPARYVLASAMRRPDNQDSCDETFRLMGSDELLQLNGGVFGFRRSERTAGFFRRWHAEWQRYGKRDQAALDRALFTDPIRVYVLGSVWNRITRYEAAEGGVILHYPLTARRWKGIVRGRLDGHEAWASIHPEPTGVPA